MLFAYTALDKEGKAQQGQIDAVSQDAAVAAVQSRGFIITKITAQAPGGGGLNMALFEGASNREIVILTRQMSTLFEAQVSALQIFRLLGEQAANPFMRRTLTAVSDDIQSGTNISHALERHPKVFSAFYVNMVKAGEESGRLDQTFMFLADYLDRGYELTSKAKGALIYPSFVVTTFVAVMALMLTMVIPRMASILEDSGKEIPLFTQLVINLSDFLIDFGIFILIALIVGGFFMFRFSKTPAGRMVVSQLQLTIPYVGDLYQKLYLSRIADNFSTMLASGISVVRAVEVTANVVGNAVYENILKETTEKIKAGTTLASALAPYQEVPQIMVQMIRVGEETGETGNILKTLAKFYQREVNQAVDTLVDLIEPMMMVLLGVGVGILLAAVLVPMYNISSGI